MAGPVDGTSRLRADSARITALAAGQLDATVPDCPGWTLRDLIVHLGAVHRWATEAVRTGADPGPRTEPPPGVPAEPDALARWFGDGAIALADELDAHDVGEPSWMPFDLPHPTVGVWLRRQTQETSLHRWDAERALGAPAPIGAELAADGIDEYFEVIVPRLQARDALELPASSLHVHCTDTAGEWTVRTQDGVLVVDREHRKGDAALRGTAEYLLLSLWGRSVPEGVIDVVGDADAAAAWLSLGGS